MNRAARILDLADPGHVLTSFAVYDCAVGWLRGGDVVWHHHGAVELRGFTEPVSIHEALSGELIAELETGGVFGRALFSPDGSRVATVGKDVPAYIWEAHTGRKLAKLETTSNPASWTPLRSTPFH